MKLLCNTLIEHDKLKASEVYFVENEAKLIKYTIKLVYQHILFAQVDLFNFGADFIIFLKQFNEVLLYLTEL